MEESRWKQVREIIRRLAQRKSTDQTYGDADIVEVFYWSVIHDRPQGWAACMKNWPIHLRRGRCLPSQATLSRRLRTPWIISLQKQIEQEAFQAGLKLPLVHYIDGKSLVIGGASKDRQAGFGWAVRGKALGYKIHVFLGANGRISCWRLTPMSTSEKTMARRMIRELQPQGYVCGDGNYDDRNLHDQCTTQGELQLIAPRFKPGAGLGHRPKSPGRLRSIELLEVSQSGFGPQLQRSRNDIERFFGQLVNYGGGLTCLPAWVRTHRRVRRWVGAKLVLAALKSTERKTSYVAA